MNLHQLAVQFRHITSALGAVLFCWQHVAFKPIDWQVIFHTGGHRAVLTATVISSDIPNRPNIITYHTCAFFLVNAFKLWSYIYKTLNWWSYQSVH